MAEFAGSIPPTDPNFFGYITEFRSKVDFFKGIAKSNWVDSIPSLRLSQKQKMGEFDSVKSALDVELRRLSKSGSGKNSPDATEAISRAAIFLYLTDRIDDFSKAAGRINKDGLYALNGSVLEWTRVFLSSGFFSKPIGLIVQEYLRNEAQFAACAELCGIELMTIQDAASAYQKRVVQQPGKRPGDG